MKLLARHLIYSHFPSFPSFFWVRFYFAHTSLLEPPRREPCRHAACRCQRSHGDCQCAEPNCVEVRWWIVFLFYEDELRSSMELADRLRRWPKLWLPTIASCRDLMARQELEAKRTVTMSSENRWENPILFLFQVLFSYPFTVCIYFTLPTVFQLFYYSFLLYSFAPFFFLSSSHTREVV
jgi:hypothetical protein